MPQDLHSESYRYISTWSAYNLSFWFVNVMHNLLQLKCKYLVEGELK